MSFVPIIKSFSDHENNNHLSFFVFDRVCFCPKNKTSSLYQNKKAFAIFLFKNKIGFDFSVEMG